MNADKAKVFARFVLCVFVLFMAKVIFVAQQPVNLEGCVTCHGQIEPMHKYGTTETLERLKDGKDAVGLSCTACHGGNPVSRLKEEAHVRPMFPREWRRNAQYTGANPDRSNTLLARESWEFVRFVNPGDL